MALEIDAGVPFTRVLFLRERPLSERYEHLAAYLVTGASALWYALALPPDDAVTATAVGVCLALGLVACAVLFLMQEWFVDWRRRLSFADAPSPLAASHVFVTHACALGATALPPKIVRLEGAPAGTIVATQPQPPAVTTRAAAAPSTMAAVSQRLRQGAPQRFKVNGASYEVWGPAPGFRIAPLPVPEREALAAYLSWTGWPTFTTAAAVMARFGANRMEVPVPEFFELAWEHAVAPFFVFQLGCVALWCLDEYVWYSLFTLGMLTFMEGVLVSQRIMTARTLRGMRPPLQAVYAYRNSAWTVVRGEDLVPLDVISLHHASPAAAGAGSGARSSGQPPSATPAPPPPAALQHVPCPADVLLLRGTVVVNEAMLTGESTPQLKEDISAFLGSEQGDAMEERLNAFAEDTGDRSHARSIVFAGTLVMTSNCPPLPASSSGSSGGSSSSGGSGSGSPGSRIPPPRWRLPWHCGAHWPLHLPGGAHALHHGRLHRQVQRGHGCICVSGRHACVCAGVLGLCAVRGAGRPAQGQVEAGAALHHDHHHRHPPRAPRAALPVHQHLPGHPGKARHFLHRACAHPKERQCGPGGL